MSRRRRRLTVLALGALTLGGIGFLSGVVVERMRFDTKRAAVIASLTSAHARVHARLMELEHRTLGRSVHRER